MKKRPFLMASIVLVLAGVVVSSGCSNSNHQETVAPEENVSTENMEENQSVKKNGSENKKNDPTISSSESGGNDEIPSNPANADELSSDSEQPAEDDEGPAADDEQTDIEMPEIINYQPSEPRLMGLQIQQQISQVTSLYGKPNREYILDADLNPVTVYEYTGFSVGFDDRETIVFVEVSTEHIDPGLNGLRLNDLREDAIKALGKPNTNTDFVMNYISSGVVLKLDIDPKTDQIQSFKLFAADV